MSSPSPIRILTTVAVAVQLVLLLLVGVLLTDTLLNIRQNLQHAPDWMWILILVGGSVQQSSDKGVSSNIPTLVLYSTNG